jgi:hypothetical protein
MFCPARRFLLRQSWQKTAKIPDSRKQLCQLSPIADLLATGHHSEEIRFYVFIVKLHDLTNLFSK